MAAPLAIASIGSSIIGGGISAYGKYEQGQAQSQMYAYQAGVADYNAKIAKDNAEYATNAGQQQAAQEGLKLGAQIGQTKANYGASNIAVDSGSAADVVASERQIGKIDTANILNNAARVAYGYQVQGQQDTMQGTLLRSASVDASKAGTIGAISSLVGTAGSVSSKWLQYGQSFGTGAGASTAQGTDPTYSTYGYGAT
jgi:hypothetical protein